MRLVIDTNCLLVSIPRFSETRWLYDGIKSGLFEIGITTEILEEYEEVRLCWCFHQQATVRFVGENTNKGEISIISGS